MKSLFIVCGLSALLLGSHRAKAVEDEVADEADVEVEAITAEADGSARNAAFVKQEERQAEQELENLKVEKAQAKAALDKAQIERVGAHKHLVQLIQEIKVYRASIQKMRVQTAREKASTKLRLEQIKRAKKVKSSLETAAN